MDYYVSLHKHTTLNTQYKCVYTHTHSIKEHLRKLRVAIRNLKPTRRANSSKTTEPVVAKLQAASSMRTAGLQRAVSPDL